MNRFVDGYTFEPEQTNSPGTLAILWLTWESLSLLRPSSALPWPSG